MHKVYRLLSMFLVSAHKEETKQLSRSKMKSHSGLGIDILASSEELIFLQNIMMRDMETRYPHARERRSILFPGNYDYHSAVHSTFAFLYISRICETKHTKRYKTLLLTRIWTFLPEEMDYITQRAQNFEMPYGQSWLLLLLSELFYHSPPSNSLLSSWIVLLSEQVYAYLQRKLTCFEGKHNSCLFVRFLFHLSLQLLRNRSTKFTLQPCALLEKMNNRFCSEDWHESKESKGKTKNFFSIDALRECVDILCGQVTKTKKKKCSYPVLSKSRLKKQPHSAGVFVSLMWRDVLKQSKCSVSTWTKFWTLRSYWRKDFWISHWISTFLVITVFLQIECIHAKKSTGIS